jgi:hypothetical protein
MLRSPPDVELSTSSDLVDDRAIEDVEADRLSHAPIARQVAQVASSEPAPLTIGIFGPWGSGKSSLLRVIGNELSRKDVLTVHLDAWRHADMPLARQFVSSTAEQLARATSTPSWPSAPTKDSSKFSHLLHKWGTRAATWWATYHERKAHREAWGLLYETRRVRRFRPDSLTRGIVALIATLIAIGVIAAFIAWLVMLIFDATYQQALERTVIAILGASVLAAIVTAVVASSTIDSEQTRPGSEEELVRALRSVRERYARHRRVVFLVDELDRCEPHEVLSTLKTMRAFLEAPQSVFVVAADRDVVDQAISGLHAAPAQPPSPYYSGTGSILDKLFQIQVDVPPLRYGRLSDLALELVSNRAGIWGRLGGDRAAEVVAILIPTHVQSPRRVKVLLNAYVTAMRIAQDRHNANRAEAADPLDKYLTIAKLVCLQTEFPRFADAVVDDPLLLPALTALAVAEEAGEVADVDTDADMDALAPFPPQTRSVALEFFTGKRSIEEDIHSKSATIGDDGVSVTEQADGHSQSQRVTELRRYVYYTREVDDPTLDIIYGTSLGARYGLDPRVADQLEREALDGQDRRASELVASLADDEDRVRAFKVICDLVRAPGMQARHAFAALIRTVDAVPSIDLSELGQELVDAVSSVSRTAELPSRYVVPVLKLTRWFPEQAQTKYQRMLLDRPEWRESDEEVATVIRTAGHWTPEVQAEARELIVSLARERPAAVIETLKSLNARTVSTLWSPTMWELAVDQDGFNDLTASIAADDRAKAFGGLIELTRAGYLEQALEAYLRLGGARHASEIDSIFELVSEKIGEPETWLKWIVEAADLPPWRSAQLGRAINEIARAAKETEITAEQAEAWLNAAAGSGAIPVESELSLPKSHPKWPQKSSTTATQRRVSETIGHCQGLWPDVHSFAHARQSAVEVMFSGGAGICGEAVEFATAEVLHLGRDGDVSPEWVASLVAEAREIPPDRLPAERAFRLVGPLAVGAAELNENFTFPSDLVEQAVENIDHNGLAVIEAWLLYGKPSRKRVVNVLEHVTGAWASLDSALATYAIGLSRRQATGLVLDLISSSPHRAKKVLREVPPEAVVQKRIAENDAEALRKAGNGSARSMACARIAAFQLASSDARRLIIEAVSSKISDGNQSAATDFSRQLPRWVYQTPGGQTLLRQLEDLSRTNHASRILHRLLGRG